MVASLSREDPYGTVGPAMTRACGCPRSTELRDDCHGQVPVLVRVVSTQAEDELSFHEPTCREFARHLRGFVAGEVLGAEGDGVQALRDRWAAAPSPTCTFTSSEMTTTASAPAAPTRSASRYSSHFCRVLVVGAVPVCDQIEDRHDHAIGDRAPTVDGEPLVRLHHPVRDIAVIETFEGVEVDDTRA